MESLRRKALESAGGAASGGSAWSELATVCEETLCVKSKDLEVAALLAEALVRKDGLAGLAAGLRVVRGLLERFWNDAYPGPDPDREGEIDLALRAKPLSRIGSAQDLLLAVREAPLSGSNGRSPVTWIDYELAQRFDAATVESDARLQAVVDLGGMSVRDWRRVLEASPASLRSAGEAVAEAARELAALESLVDMRFTAATRPRLVPLAELLERMGRELNRGLTGPVPGPAANVTPSEVRATNLMESGMPATEGLRGREEAYEALRRVGEYLRRIEPHSPVPCLIDRAVQWGGMSFEGVFRDVVRDEGARSAAWTMLGLGGNQEGP